MQDTTAYTPKHAAPITRATLLARYYGLRDARVLPLPKEFGSLEQLREAVETKESQRSARIGGYRPRHSIDQRQVRRPRLVARRSRVAEAGCYA